MVLNLDMPVWINGISCVLALLIVMYLGGRKNEFGLKALRILMGSLAGWAFVNGLELAVTDIPLKIFLSKISYIGIVMTVSMWLMFALLYRGQAKGIRAWQKAIVLVPSIGILCAVFTNEWHRTVWPSFTIDPASSGNRLIYGHGPVLYVYAVLSYATIIYATVVLLRASFAERGMQRWQSALMVAAAVVPLIGNMVYFFGLTPWPSLDTTPILFTVSGLAFAIGIMRFRMFDLLPVARDRLFDSLADAVLILDRDGRIVDMNDTALDWFMKGREWGEWQGRRPHEALAWFPASVMMLPAPAEEPVCLPLDGDRWLELDRTDLRRQDGGREGSLLTFRDITRRKRAEMQLQAEKRRVEEERAGAEAARRAADKANQAKSTFLTNMSHEMRTPLIAITGYLAMLEETALTPEQARFAGEVGVASDALLGLVNEMLDLSRIEAGRMDFEEVPFRLDALLEECASMVSVRLLGKPLDLSLDIRTQVLSVRSDRARMRQMVLNLLGNAAKFTESGFIQMTLRDAHEAELATVGGTASQPEHGAADVAVGRRWLALDVQDTGPGIADELQPRLFEPFTQADRDTARKYGGSGLGLPITRRIAEAMGGSVRLESWPGLGSTFTLLLPFPIGGPLPETADWTDSTTRAPGRRYLVHQGQRTGVAPVVLSTATATPDAPFSGERARHGHERRNQERMPAPIAATGDAGTHGDLFAVTGPTGDTGFHPVELYGIQLPKTNGESVTGTAPLLSPASPDGQGAPLGSAGHDPVPEAGTPTSGPSPADASDAVSRNGIRKGCRVLLVEDTIANRNLMVLLLEKAGCVVRAAGNGLEAVDLFGSATCDIILMDIQMPVMDGIEAARFIRTLERGASHVPIIALTANAMAGERDACFEAGMDDFLTKPVKPQVLTETLARWCGRPQA